jgi:pSer/pThr/pTyr-binding forkhead associated (FHA) protein
MPRLVIKRSKGKLQLLDLSQATTEVGRSDEMDLILQNVSVSRHHARLLLGEQGLKVEDVGSQNGVRVNGDRLEPNSARLVAVGDTVSIGKFDLILLEPGEHFFKGRFLEYMTPYSSGGLPSAQEATYAMSAAEAEALAREKNLIRNAKVVSAERALHFWHPEDQKLTIGTNAMVIVGGMMTPAIAAEVVWERNQHILKKLGLMGKVTANGQAIKAHGLRDGDQFRVGDKDFLYRTQ